MIDFNKFDESELKDVSPVLNKNIEKSALNNYYLFTSTTTEKAKVFLLCYRLLDNIYNVLEKKGGLDNLRKEIKKELDLLFERYNKINQYLSNFEVINYNRHSIENKMFHILNDTKDVNNLIDAFSILIERQNIIHIARSPAIIMEGESEREFKKTFTPVEQ